MSRASTTQYGVAAASAERGEANDPCSAILHADCPSRASSLKLSAQVDGYALFATLEET